MRVQTRKQICAFVDVLGGAKLFSGKDRARAATFLECMREFERRLNKWSHHFPKHRQSAAMTKTFSDNILVAFPFGSNSKMEDEDVIALFLVELKHQIHELTLLAGFPVRGAVTIGSLALTDHFVYGPALVEAAELEKQTVFPRIAVGRSVLRQLSPDARARQLLVQDADGTTFIHYLMAPMVSLKSHRQFIEEGLQKNSAHVRERQKYEWLAQYHNFSARLLGQADACIDFERPDAFSVFT